jgi:hypothetical protein
MPRHSSSPHFRPGSDSQTTLSLPTFRLTTINTMTKLTTALVTLDLSEKSLSTLRKTFQTVHHYPSPSSPPSPSILESIDILFGPPQRLPSSVKSLDALPNLKFIQLGSAGADGPLGTAALKEWVEKGDQGRKGREVKMMTASGTHVLSIPPWAVASVIMLYHQIPRMLSIARVCFPDKGSADCRMNNDGQVSKNAIQREKPISPDRFMVVRQVC